MAIADKLNDLITQRNNLADNLNTMGVSASQEETLTSLVPKVLEISSSDNEYFKETVTKGSSTKPGIVDSIIKLPSLKLAENNYSTDRLFYYLSYLESIESLDISHATDTQRTFNGCRSLTNIPKLNISNSTNTYYMFSGCNVLKNVSLTSTAKSTNTSYMFNSCNALTNIEGLDLSNSTSASYMFQECNSLTNVNLVSTAKLTTANNMFYNCKNLETVEGLDTSNLTNATNMFYNCQKLHTLPLLDFSKVTNVTYAFYYCNALANVGGFKDYGKAFSTSSSANYSNYSLTLDRGGLTEDSIINILENLYDIASMGCNTQTIYLGSTHLAKLTSERGQTALANAQTKGWTIA